MCGALDNMSFEFRLKVIAPKVSIKRGRERGIK